MCNTQPYGLVSWDHAPAALWLPKKRPLKIHFRRVSGFSHPYFLSLLLLCAFKQFSPTLETNISITLSFRKMPKYVKSNGEQLLFSDSDTITVWTFSFFVSPPCSITASGFGDCLMISSVSGPSHYGRAPETAVLKIAVNAWSENLVSSKVMAILPLNATKCAV